MKIKVKYMNGREKVYDNIESIIGRGARLMIFEYNSLLDEYIVLRSALIDSLEIITREEV